MHWASKDPVATLVEIEETLSTIHEEVHRPDHWDRPPYKTARENDLPALKAAFEDAVQRLDHLSDTLVTPLKRDVFDLLEQLRQSSQNQQVSQVASVGLETFLDRPHEIREESEYVGTFPNGVQQKMVFSDVVVNGILQGNPIVATRVIRSILNGRIPSHAPKNGIVLMARHKNPSVYEIKLVGTAIGAIRVVGYLHEGVFHWVGYEKSSNHDEHWARKLHEMVQRAWFHRGHGKVHH